MNKTAKQEPTTNTRGPQTSRRQGRRLSPPVFRVSQIPIQTKPASPAGRLTIGRPGDRYEREADSIADRVMLRISSPAPSKAAGKIPAVQRKCADCEEREGHVRTKPLASEITPMLQKQEAAPPSLQLQRAMEEEEEEVRRKPLSGAIAPMIQRQGELEEEAPAATKSEEDMEETPAPEESEEPNKLGATGEDTGELEDDQLSLKTQPGAAAQYASPSLASRLQSTKGSGQTLPKNTRTQMESAFGADFSGVRIHTGQPAVRMNRELHAQAFTHGRDVYFNQGKFRPGTTEGQRLLAHELVHVGQQGRAHTNLVNGNYLPSEAGERNGIIQKYGKNVHSKLTRDIGRMFFNSRKSIAISDVIADENQTVDKGWSHPTLTSIIPFIHVLLQNYGGYAKYIPRRFMRRLKRKKTFRFILRQSKQILRNFRITQQDALHFPRRHYPVRQLNRIILNASKAGSDSDVRKNAAEFGKFLHVYQDSYSHSFPPRAAYSKLSNAKFKSFVQRHLASILKGIVCDKQGNQIIYSNTLHGKGAVIRHALLGNYPDFYLVKTEQIQRDNKMRIGTTVYVSRLYRAFLSSPVVKARRSTLLP